MLKNTEFSYKVIKDGQIQEMRMTGDVLCFVW